MSGKQHRVYHMVRCAIWYMALPHKLPHAYSTSTRPAEIAVAGCWSSECSAGRDCGCWSSRLQLAAIRCTRYRIGLSLINRDFAVSVTTCRGFDCARRFAATTCRDLADLARA